MKKMKKILALVIAMTMVMASMSLTAFAATGALTPDTSMTVEGLDEGDEVNFYKLIKWVPGTGWAWNDGVETAAADTTGGKTALTLPALTTITGYLDTTKATPEYVAGQISAADGGILAQVAQRLSGTGIPHTETVATGGNSVTYNKPAYPDGATDAQKETIDNDFMGLYVALVNPAEPKYLYNPIFVAADFNPDSTNTNKIGTEEIAVGTLSYSDDALAKKEEVKLTKTSGTPAQGSTAADPMFDVAIGDTIPFTIDSVVPAFSSSYQNPQYEITDTMDTGLELLATPAIVVKVIDSTRSADDKADDTKWTTLSSTGDPAQYTVTTSTNGFTVALDSTYLKNNGVPKDIKVTYSAKVTQIPDQNVVQKENTATVKFSNNPGDSSSYSLLEDKTNHYTFSLDANLLGNNSWENSELVKIGLKPDGTEITQETLNNGTEAGVLEGAKFGLYTDSACGTLYTNSNVSPAVTGEFTSDAHGKLNISGLDAGTYYLKEISAPTGYIKSTDIWEIKITPTYATENAGSYTNDDDILVNYDAYDYLTSYTVAVKNLTTNTTVTSEYQITNDGTHDKTATNAGTVATIENEGTTTTTVTGTDETTKLNNTQGTELPSTGGIGTTIFYVFGSVLVIVAGVVLVTRRRMNA